METALYLLPVTLGDTPVETVLPSYNKEVILGIRHFIVEDVRSARRFLKKVDREIDIDSLTVYTLNKHTSPEDISGYLKPLEAGNPMGVISEAGMTGMYCDNQPDFTWLQPYEEKSWVQYFMPYQKVGMVKNATRDALINMIPEEGGKMKVILYTTAAHKEVRVMLTNTENGKIYLDALTAVAPDNSYINTVDCDTQKMEELKLTVLDEKGKVLVSYQAAKPEIKPIPEPAKAALDPKKIASMEQLFLTGHHLEQYRHATYLPMDYYMEALSRDESDIRCNNAVGLLLMRRGRFAEAQKYFDRAIKTQTERNPNPYEGEPYYNLGWSKKMQGDIDGAYDAFFKATWNAAWQDSGYMGLAQIDMIREDYTNGLDHIDRSLYRNWLNHKGRQLKVSFLRKTGDFAKAEALINDSLAMDKFNMGCRFESYLIHTLQGNTEAAAAAKAEMKALMRGAVHSYLELSSGAFIS